MERLFSGDKSIKLWERINADGLSPEAHDALYLMGCTLQELETQIEVLEKKIKYLEARERHSHGLMA